jgi:tetratricopeptide (TPR) repeat protein
MFRPRIGIGINHLFYGTFSDYIETLNFYHDALADPNQTNSLINEGLVFYNQTNYKNALNYFEKALSIDSRNSEALNDKADALRKLGNNTESLKYYDKALAIDPNSTDALNDKGVALQNLGNYTEALKYYDKVLAIDPNYIDSLNNKGNILSLNLKNYTEALKYFDKALAVDPNSFLPLYNKGTTMSILENYTEALKYYDKALAIDAKNEDLLNDKGNALRKLGKYSEALNYFDKALAINPNHTSALGHKGSVLINMGRNEDALVYLDKSLKTDPSNGFALSNKVIALHNLGRDEEARVYYDRFQVLQASSPVTFLTYRNSTIGIQIQYPSNWDLEKHGLTPTQPGVIFTSPVDMNSSNYPVKLFLYIDSSEGKSLEKLTFDQLTQLRNDSDTILSANTINISRNHPASQVLYTGEISGLPTKELTVYAIDNDQAYTIWYLAQPNTFNKYIPYVQKMIDSIRFIGKENTTITTSNGIENIYQNDDLGIKVRYPSDWTVEERDGPVFQPPDSFDSSAYVQITQNYLGKNMTLDKDLHETINSFRMQAEDFRVLDSKANGTLAGIPVYDFLSTYRTDGYDAKLRSIGMLLQNQREITIAYFSKSDSFDTNLEEANKIIDSFEVIDSDYNS